MRKDKEKAIGLRKAGFSYKRIRDELGIATSTLAGWFKNEPWSQELKNRLSREVSLSNPKALKAMAEANKARWKLTHEEYRSAAIREFENLKNDPLFIAGLMLYWGEGDKKIENGQVSLSNSDPHLVRLFYLFLVKALGVSPERITLSLILYPDLVDSVQKNMWSKITKIPLSNFRGSTVIKGRHPTKRNSYGVCIIRVNSRQLKEKVIKWIDLLYKNLEFKCESKFD